MLFFPKRSDSSPKIYAYTELDDRYKGLIKIGYTERNVLARMKEHYPTAGPKGIERYQVVFEQSSMRNDGTFFKDYEVHKMLEKSGINRIGTKNEWFKCSVKELSSAFIAVNFFLMLPYSSI